MKKLTLVQFILFISLTSMAQPKMATAYIPGMQFGKATVTNPSGATNFGSSSFKINHLLLKGDAIVIGLTQETTISHRFTDFFIFNQ
ncbi:MAG: hypothetical protein AABZ32_12450 [Bacteroidota bacterium]